MGCNTRAAYIERTTSQFQYPLRVEVGCNATTPRAPQLRFAVSVPSTGRSGLQPFSYVADADVVTSFSTLYGSKWVATGHNATSRRTAIWFQYPLRVEVGCNPIRRIGAVCRNGFQYPLRVEVGCNGCQRAPRARHAGCFSTLYGSKWVATYLVGRGSEPIKVSVPSTGRSGLQLGVDFCQAELLDRFQYPLRVEVGCNTTPEWHLPMVCMVSVPSTGRSGLQQLEWFDTLGLS